jgi:hypothetical protein
MKKINESELLSRVSGLRAYMAEAEPATNPWPEGSPQAQAWVKLSPQVQAKIGKADPTDPIIVSRMTQGEFGGLFGGGVTDANKDGTATAATLSNASNAKVAQANTADMAQLKTLVDKLKAMSTAPAGQAGQPAKPATGSAASAPAAPATGDKRTPAEIQASKDLGNFAGESLNENMSRLIAKLTVLEDAPQTAVMPATPAAAPAAPAANPERDALVKQIQDLMAKINANNENPPPELATALSDAQAAIDAASKAAPAVAADPAKPADPQAAQKKPFVPATPDPKVLALQQELIKKGAKIKADGVMGPLTQAAQKQFGGQAGQKAPAAGTPPELAAIPNPKPGQEMWVKGTRYKYSGGQQTRGGMIPGTWKPTFEKGDWGWNSNQAKSRADYSSPELAQQQAAQKKPGAPVAPAAPKAPAAPVPAKESVSYSEDQALARIIQLSR